MNSTITAYHDDSANSLSATGSEATDNSKNSDQPEGRKRNLKTAGAIATASAASFSKVFISLSKGVLIDILIAAAEGMRAVPHLYSHETKSYGTVTSWKSGAAIAEKAFGHGMYEGFTDIFVFTYHGKKEEGAFGAAKGLGKGLVSMTTKTTAGVVGLVTYPVQGAFNSVRSTVKRRTSMRIEEGKIAEGKWLVDFEAAQSVDRVLLGSEFENMKKGHGGSIISVIEITRNLALSRLLR